MSQSSDPVQSQFIGDPQFAYRAGLAEGFRRGVEAALKVTQDHLPGDGWTNLYDKIRALREGDKP